MNRSFYLQFLALAVFISLMGSLNIYAQEHSTGPIPEFYLNKHLSVTPNQNTPGYNPLATLAYAYGAQIGQTLSMPLPAGQPFTNLAAFTFPSFASSMTKGGDGNYYLTTTYSATGPVIPKLYTVSTGGVVTLLGDITGTGTNSVNGISYNPNNSTYYLMGATTPTNSLLYSFDVNTRVATLIGTVGSGALMIDLCFNFSGTCYTYDIVTDNAYTVNITTGEAILLGPLGFSANFGQGMGYDFETGWIYLSGFRNLPSNDGQLRVMDPQTGYTNLLASYGVNQVAPFAPASIIAALPGPGRATNPTIANGATNVLISTPSIGWTNAGGATSVEVFFGTNPQSLTSIYSGAAVTSRPVTLAYSTTYYWYVNETSGGNTTKGTLWSFTTEAEIVPVINLPVVVDFEDGIFPPTGWSQSAGSLWKSSAYYLESSGASGYGVGGYSALADFYAVNAAQDLISLEYNSTGASNPTLSFDWAYATYSGEVDEMDIYYSTNAGANWLILLAMPGGTNGILNPFNLVVNPDPYFPLDTEWSTMSLPLPANTTNVKFTAISAFGNWLYLDNIKISAGSFVDGFENPPYVFPGQVACQNPTNWTTWTATPCGADDATISTNYAFTGTQSALIDYASPRQVDLIKPLGNKTTGKWYITFFTYIPTGKTGYFNTLAVLPTPTADWGMEVYFDAGGGGRLMNVPSAPVNFTWTEATWNQVMVVVDFNATPTTAEFWFGKVGQLAQLYTWDWTQGGTITDQLAGNDIFAPTGTSADEMYIDDYYFSDVPPPIQRLANDVGLFTIDMDYQYAPGTITPKATVKNYGTDANTFNVTMTISGGYTSTKTVPSIADGETYQVTFDGWTQSAAGSYTVDVCTELGTDDNADNNCQTRGVNIWDDSGTWTSGADYPITSYNGIGVSYNDGTTDWLYVMGGNTTSTLRTECYKYNVNANTWTQIASLPEARLISAGAVVGNYIYVIGGSDGSTNTVTYHNTTYRYDIAGNSWSQVATLPLLYGWGRAVAYNDGTDDYIYLAGGIEQDLTGATFYIADVYLYDVAANTWTLTPSPMPDGIFGGGFSIVGNTLVYATGATPAGISNVVYVGTINPADPTDITWQTMSSYPGNIKQVYGTNGTDVMATMPNLSIGNSKNGHPPLAAIFPAGGIYRNHAHPWGDDGIIMGGGTPTSDYIAADPGPCYVYKPSTDTWTAQENMLVPVGAHQSGTFHDGDIWKYIIASGFGVSAVTSATQIYTQTLGGATTFNFALNVSSGWNMVSVPGNNTTGMTPLNWWSDLNGTVYKFIPGSGYSGISTTAPGEGYWLKNNTTMTYNYTGIEIVAHNPIPATAGWNMLGGFEDVVDVNSLTTSTGSILYPIYQFNPGAGYATATNLTPGKGYWVKVSQTCTITIPEALAKGSEPVEYFKEDWGRIMITDAAGSQYTLYGVKGEVDLNNYELPPLPPAGNFDIRFGSGRIAEDLNSAMQTIQMSGVVYPITVRVEGMDIRLQDETGKSINVNLKSGEDVVIGDATIQKLMVSGETIPTVYALEQNYPNPFNPSTVIEFSLPEDVGNVQLSIYNALGEKVAELVNTALTAGKYQYQWNAQNVATGMYIYELRTDNFVSVKKMLLLK